MPVDAVRERRLPRLFRCPGGGLFPRCRPGNRQRELEARAAALLPALLLARIDGKSPVEYIDDEAIKSGVRAFSVAADRDRPADLAFIRNQWAKALPAILDKT